MDESSDPANIILGFIGAGAMVCGLIAAVVVTMVTFLNPVYELPEIERKPWSHYRPSMLPVPYLAYQPELRIRVHEPQLVAFSAFLEQDIANHGGWRTDTPETNMPQNFAVPHSYLDRLRPLTEGEMHFVDWANWASENQPERADEEADLAISVRYASHLYVRPWAMWSMLASGGVFAAGVASLVTALIREGVRSSGRGRRAPAGEPA